MKPVDHAVIEAAVQAKRAQQEKAPPKPQQSSVLGKAVTAGVWVAAAGTFAAMILAN